MQKEISILEYGVANTGSIVNMFRKLGINVRIVTTVDEVLSAQKLVLPGVGAFDYGMLALQRKNLDRAIIHCAKEKHIPMLGICLGMQLLCDGSEEGSAQGLGLIPGQCRKNEIHKKHKVRVPNMGWRYLTPQRADLLLSGIEENARFYFVHSYHVVPNDPKHVTTYVEYGNKMAAIIRSGVIFGVQFHPEKSHRFGLQLFKNFSSL